jgi:serine/arginine repetitive matrix protein 2
MWFNSLNSGIIFSSPVVIPDPSSPSATPRASQPYSRAPAVSFRDQHRRYASESSPSPPLTYSRAGTPTAGGLFGSSTTASDHQSSEGRGSIALRAMRSVRSLARVLSWAYMKGEEGSGVAAALLFNYRCVQQMYPQSSLNSSWQWQGHRSNLI